MQNHQCNTPGHQLPNGCQSCSSPAVTCRLCVYWEWLSDHQMGKSEAPLLHFPSLLPKAALWDASVVLRFGEDVLRGSSQHTLPAYIQGKTCLLLLHFSYHILTTGILQWPSSARECLPAAGTDPCCLHPWSRLKPQLITAEPSASSDGRARHHGQGLPHGGRSTRPCHRFSSPPETKPRRYFYVHTQLILWFFRFGFNGEFAWSD